MPGDPADPRPSLERQDASVFASARRRFKSQKKWKQILEVTATVCTILGLPVAIVVPILLESPTPAPAPASAPTPPTSENDSSPAKQDHDQVEQLKCGVSVLGSTSDSAYYAAAEGEDAAVGAAPSCGDARVPAGTTSRTKGRWFAFVGSGVSSSSAGGSVVTLSTCTSYSGLSSYDTRIRVYHLEQKQQTLQGGLQGALGEELHNASGDDNLICVAGNDDIIDGSCQYGDTFSEVSFIAEMGVTYLILLDGRQPEGGEFVLNVDCSGKSEGEGEDDQRHKENSSQSEPTAPSSTSLPPTSSPTAQTLLFILSSNSQDGGAALRTEGTPQRMAYEWLATPPSDRNVGADVVEVYGFVKLFERFALAVLYYSTNGEQWWDSDNWMNEYDHCNWYGVQCNYIKNVERLDLQDNRLEGSIPPEIWMLTNVFKLWLPDNGGLTGTITTHIGRLNNAVTISLGSNALEGTVPTELGNLSNLEGLRLSNNNLKGKIPTELGKLNKLG